MAGNGMKLILGSVGHFGARTALASFVLWGSVFEMTRPSFDHFACLPCFDAPATPDGIRYTICRATFIRRGWPFEYSYKSDSLGSVVSVHDKFWPFALAWDIAFVAVFLIAAWSLFGGWQMRFRLARLFDVMASLALMLTFHVRAWDHEVDWSKVAIDIGIFSTAFVLLRYTHGCCARLSSKWQRGRYAAIDEHDSPWKPEALARPAPRQQGTGD
jgi:hypothetical protein